MKITPEMLVQLQNGYSSTGEHNHDDPDMDISVISGMEDQYSVLTRADDEEKGRLKSPFVSYMEISDESMGFSCGNCRFANKSTVYCEHQAVMSPVSPHHGCCNLFKPAMASIVFPEPEVGST